MINTAERRPRSGITAPAKTYHYGSVCRLATNFPSRLNGAFQRTRDVNIQGTRVVSYYLYYKKCFQS